MNKQWEVGKTYKLVDICGFTTLSGTNKIINERLKPYNYTFTVTGLEAYGVTSINHFGHTLLGLSILFRNHEFKYFEEVTTNVVTKVVEWLDKYQQVASTDYHIGKIDTSDYGVCLTTDHGDILGSKQVVDFINNRYSQLKSAENQSKLKELQAKKDKLMLELASVDGEINELEAL